MDFLYAVCSSSNSNSSMWSHVHGAVDQWSGHSSISDGFAGPVRE